MEEKQKFTGSLEFRIVTATIITLVLFSAIVGTMGYFRFTESMTDTYVNQAVKLVETATMVLDPDEFDRYLEENGQSEDYQRYSTILGRICTKQDAKFMYAIKVDESDFKHYTIIFNAANANDEQAVKNLWNLGDVVESNATDVDDDYEAMFKELYTGGVEYEAIIKARGFDDEIPHLNAFVPLWGDDGTVKGIAGVQLTMAELNRGRYAYLAWLSIVMLASILIVTIVGRMFFSREFVGPIRTILAEAKRFASENTKLESSMLKKNSKVNEINMLADSINKMEDETVKYIEDLTHITAEKERVNTELDLASRIQVDMLPNIFPPFPDREEFDIYASSTPAREVGGDFYDFFFVDHDHLAIIMADVSGKGIPAAMFMAMVKNMLETSASMQSSPKKVLENVNERLCATDSEGMFVTVWLGILDIRTGVLTSANAGHEYPVFKEPDGEFEVVRKKHGFVLGGMDGVTYREYEDQMKPGAKLFLYTDGVPEATTEGLEMFTLERTVAALNEVKDSNPKEILEHVENTVKRFVNNAEQFDDFTMLCIEYKGE